MKSEINRIVRPNMKRILFVTFAFLFVVSACRKQDATPDKNRLDSLISRVPPYTIGMTRFEGTNLVTRAFDAEKSMLIANALSETNRVVIDDSERKTVTHWFEFSYGTNFVSRLGISDDGVFLFDAYGFKLKSPLPIDFSPKPASTAH